MSRREAALAEREVLSRKNAELEAFSARVAHDLLSPLMTVSLALGLAEQRLSTPADERLRTMVARAGSSLQRVRQLVADLLDFARASAKPPPGVETAVAPLLQGLVGDLQPLASAAGVDLKLESGSTRRVQCAAGILSSILSNLIQNAIRHAERGAPSASSRCARPRRAGPEVRFEVEDTGDGVAPRGPRGTASSRPYVSHSTEGSEPRGSAWRR